MGVRTFIDRLADRLRYEDDISLEEALEIAEFIKNKGKELDPSCSHYNGNFADSISYWFSVVEYKIPAGGNYICTILFTNIVLRIVRQRLKDRMCCGRYPKKGCGKYHKRV